VLFRSKGAQVNVQSDWTATSGDALILNKPTIPSGDAVIDWTDDQSSNSKVIHTSNYTNTTYTVGDGGLTQKNFTTALNTKLTNIADSANNYSLPIAASDALGGIQVGTNLSIDVNGVLSSANTSYSDATTNAAGLMSTAHYDKLQAIDDSADVTDATTVLAAGAVMTSGNQTIAGEKTFNSTIVGSITGNAVTATKAQVTLNNATDESNVIAFVANASATTGAHDLEMDENLTYNPSTDTLTAPNLVAGTGITGTLQTAAQPNITSVGTLNSVDIDGGAIDGTAIGANSATTAKFTTLNASDATTLDGAVTLGNASGDAVTVEGTITVKNTATFNGVIHQF